LFLKLLDFPELDLAPVFLPGLLFFEFGKLAGGSYS